MAINKDRIADRLKQLAEIGKKDDGVHCLALSREENAAHGLAREFMERAGLAVRVDAAGNLVGRREGADPKAAVVMTGSHLDSVYGGGMFDGRLGVVAGIEALQVMRETGVRTKHPIEVCVYRDEEGSRFIGSYSGAKHMTAPQDPTVLDHVDGDGVTIREALKDCGIDPDRVGEARLPPGYAKAHLELHIEQGVVLESKGLAVGVVTGICCQIRGEVVVRGRAAHAGATPMPLRHDALCAAAEIVLAMEEEASRSENCVATVGRIAALPGGVNVVPGEARFSIDMRHLDPEVLERLFAKVRLRIDEICRRRGVAHEVSVMTRQCTAMPCADEVMERIAESCAELGLPVFAIPSSADHDTVAFIPFCPSGMIFVRSRDGISHNRDEYSSFEDCAAGAEVLYRTLLKLAVEA